MFHLSTIDRLNVQAEMSAEGMTRLGTFAVLAAGLMAIAVFML
ncbi:MAG: hypothetical protein U0790_05270 [Isosphaeraceae bacterium]